MVRKNDEGLPVVLEVSSSPLNCRVYFETTSDVSELCHHVECEARVC